MLESDKHAIENRVVQLNFLTFELEILRNFKLVFSKFFLFFFESTNFFFSQTWAWQNIPQLLLTQTHFPLITLSQQNIYQTSLEMQSNTFVRPKAQPYGSPMGRNPVDLVTTVPEYGNSLTTSIETKGYIQATEPSTRLSLNVNVQEQTTTRKLSSENHFPFPSFPPDKHSHHRSPPRKRGRTLRQRQMTTLEDIILVSVGSSAFPPSRTTIQQRLHHSSSSHHSSNQSSFKHTSSLNNSSTFTLTPTSTRTTRARPRTATSSHITVPKTNAIYGGGWKNRPKTASTTRKKRSSSHRPLISTTATTTNTTRLKRRSQRKRNQQTQQIEQNQQRNREVTNRPETTFVQLELESLHNYSTRPTYPRKNKYRRGRNNRKYRTTTTITNNNNNNNNTTTTRRGTPSNRILMQQGWHKPKKTPTYARTSRTNTIGYHREFTPIRPAYFSMAQNGILQVVNNQDNQIPRRQVQQQNVNVNNISVFTPYTSKNTSNNNEVQQSQEDVAENNIPIVDSVVAMRTTRKSPEPVSTLKSECYLFATKIVANWMLIVQNTKNIS